MTDKYGFKVCRIYRIRRGNVRYWETIWDETFVSFSMTGTNCSIYKVGEITERRPGYGPLALWRTFEQVRGSVPRPIRNHFQCFECEYIPSTDVYLWNSTLKSVAPPKGTILADSVMLLRAVPWKLDPSFMPTERTNSNG